MKFYFVITYITIFELHILVTLDKNGIQNRCFERLVQSYLRKQIPQAYLQM